MYLLVTIPNQCFFLIKIKTQKQISKQTPAIFRHMGSWAYFKAKEILNSLVFSSVGTRSDRPLVPSLYYLKAFASFCWVVHGERPHTWQCFADFWCELTRNHRFANLLLIGGCLSPARRLLTWFFFPIESHATHKDRWGPGNTCCWVKHSVRLGEGQVPGSHLTPWTSS